MNYLDIKTLHILSMVLLFGTGLGSAFYKWMADRSGQLETIAVTNRHVVLADWLFTTPTVLFQPLSGWWMVSQLGLPLATPWVAASLALYALAGVCWLPVVWLQIRMRDLSAKALCDGQPLPAHYHCYARLWFCLGVPAFIAMLAVVFMMVNKHIPGAL
ncbi:DUF2269 domain-containing protein [uncultured Aquitalea sp.]|uniref:DUF2269 family protein n=1 Tax=uncultured Aquitalea sp. TaxID=540272 RepID=UPI0025E03C6C|nr:DUF2269 domain-containing protein [uncultured Aquitalea sp.]